MDGSGSNPNPEKDRLSASRSLSDDKPAGRRLILIVEDNPADVFLIRRAISEANLDSELHVIEDGEQAVRFFDDLDAERAAPSPALVVLDINLPRKSGGEVLQRMRKSRGRNAFVIVVSTSDSARDREEMAKLGANSYFRKPSEYADFMKLGGIIKEFLGAPRTD